MIGRLTKEPDLRYTQNGTAVCQFTLAVDRQYKKEGEQNADFINIVVWNKSAENAAQYLDKGRQCAVEGRLQIRNYEKDGQKHYVTEVVAERVEFLGTKQDSVGKNRLEDAFVEVDFNAEEIPF